MTQIPITIKSIPRAKRKFGKIADAMFKKLIRYNSRMAGAYRVRDLCVVARNARGKIIGGLKGYTYWGWLYVSLSWVDRKFRGQGIGKTLIQEMERIARGRDCRRAFVESWSFQAPGFYRKTGYRQYARLPGFPLGQTLHFFHKKFNGRISGSKSLIRRPGFTIKTICRPKNKFKKIEKYLRSRIMSFIGRKIGNQRFEEFGLMASDEKGKLSGSLLWNVYGGWAHIDAIWVEKKYRGQGLGRRLLQAMEKAAKRKGYKNMQLRIYSFHAPGFFKKMGFRVYGRLKNLPEGHTRIYLRKKLV